jgi:hypothetical protein
MRSDHYCSICDDVSMSNSSHTASSEVQTQRRDVQACVRCGAPVDLETALCERCNPLGLAQPSPSQTHGTVFLGIGAAVLVLAALAGASAKGVGPFTATISGGSSIPGGLGVQLVVENTGVGAGSATCQVTTSALGKAGLQEIVNTPRIDGGARVSIQAELKAFGVEPIPLRVTCGN